MMSNRKQITVVTTDKDKLGSLECVLQSEILRMESEIVKIRKSITKYEEYISDIRTKGQYTYTYESNIK